MTDIATLVQGTWDILYGEAGSERPAEDTLSANITNSATSLTPVTTSMWKRGNYAEFAADGEMVIFAADSAGATVVRRAQRGTTAAAHSSGEVMLKNPDFPRYRVVKRIGEVIRNDLWPHVWTWHRDSVTPSPTSTMYPLDQFVEEVVLVYQENLAGEEHWHPLPPNRWDVERQIETVTNLNLLRLREVYDFDETVYYVGKLRPDPSTAGLTALDPIIADMIPWATAAKLMAGRSAQSKGDPARTRQDQDGQAFRRDYGGLMSEFLRLRDQYARQLTTEVAVEPRFRTQFRRSW